MNELPFSPKLIIWTGILCLLIAGAMFCLSYFHTNTKLVFCNVGQGDGAYIRIRNKIDMIIDTGSGREMLHCLGRHMPFYDRRIEIVVISHPQMDHCGGLEYVLDHYAVDHFLAPPVNNDAQFFQRLKSRIDADSIHTPYQGDKMIVQDATFEFFWPTQNFIDSTVTFNNESPDIFGSTHIDPNDYSLIFTIKIDAATILFTGDAYPHILDRIEIDEKISILKVPHHGSKNGVTEKLLQDTSPDISVISVGQNNKHGHPSPEILALFHAMGLDYLRTDREKDIVYTIDFQTFSRQ